MSTVLKRIGVLGEAMGEMFTHSPESFSVGIGGDTFNAAVYMAQIRDQIKPHFFSAIGTDPFSQLFLKQCQQYGISDQFLGRDEVRSIGLYSITTDDEGERRFNYWRSDSAARNYLNDIDQGLFIQELLSCDAVYLSGITLAIMSPDARSTLLQELSGYSKGSVYFDDNFRPLLWQNEDVQLWYDKMYNAADILLLSVEDQLLVQGVETKEELVSKLTAYRGKTIILRDGPNPITVIRDGEIDMVEVSPVKPTDTTAAGDSFTGTYIALVESGVDLLTAIKSASKVSGYVIQQPGALVQLPETLLGQ